MKKLTITLIIILAVLIVLIVIGAIFIYGLDRGCVFIKCPNAYFNNTLHQCMCGNPPLVGGCAGVYKINQAECCSSWAKETNATWTKCIGGWVVENDACIWKCGTNGTSAESLCESWFVENDQVRENCSGKWSSEDNGQCKWECGIV